MLPYRTVRNLRTEDFRVRPAERPGWVAGTMRLPRQGEEIFCAAGSGKVTALHGKTGDGSRLLQIELPDPALRPFFAAASNVLLPPAGADESPDSASARGDSRGMAAATAWLGGSGSSAHIG